MEKGINILGGNNYAVQKASKYGKLDIVKFLVENDQ